MTVQADILKAIEGIEHGFQLAGQALSERIFHCRQVHGAEIVDARSLSESGRHAADGVFSEGPLAVAVVTADCLPILMSSRDGRVVAALHGGWQGLVAGIVGAAVARFNARGVASADIRVAIGPGIKACCYEVSAGFIEALQVGHGRLWEGAAPPWSQRRPLPERPAPVRSARAKAGGAGRLAGPGGLLSPVVPGRRRRAGADRSQRRLHLLFRRCVRQSSPTPAPGRGEAPAVRLDRAQAVTAYRYCPEILDSHDGCLLFIRQ